MNNQTIKVIAWGIAGFVAMPGGYLFVWQILSLPSTVKLIWQYPDFNMILPSLLWFAFTLSWLLIPLVVAYLISKSLKAKTE